MATGRLLLSIHRPDYKKPLGKNQYKSIRPPDLLDMSRVTSDALPHSLNATTIHLDREETPNFKNSSIMEVLSSPEEPMENRKDKSLDFELINTQPSKSSSLRSTKNARPLSAPTKKAASVTSVSAHKSHTLPTKKNSLLKQTKELQSAEREKRSASIHNNAQILLKYAQNRQSSHSSSSLHTDNQSPSRVSKLFEVTTDQQKSVADSGSPSLSCSHHSSSSITMDEHSSSSTPLNLRHISMDETRLVSVMQMDSIWKQVESGDDSPSLTAQRSSSLLFEGDEDEVTDINEPILPSKDTENHTHESGGIFSLQPSSLATEGSMATLTTSSTPNLVTSTPVSTSIPSPICTPAPSSISPAPIAASTPVTQSEPLFNNDTSVSVPKKDAETNQRITSLDGKGVD